MGPYLEKRVFVGIISQGSRVDIILDLWWPLHTDVLIKRGHADTTSKAMKRVAESGVMPPQAKDCLGRPAIWGRGSRSLP